MVEKAINLKTLRLQVHWIRNDAQPTPKDLTLEQARGWMLRDERSLLRVIGVNSVIYTVCFIYPSSLGDPWLRVDSFQGKWILEEHDLKFEVVADVAGDKWNT